MTGPAPAAKSKDNRGGPFLPTVSTSPELSAFTAVLEREGLHGALRHLNARTPFRFTGVYAFGGETLRNVALFDRWNPQEAKGADAPMDETFCAIVGLTDGLLEVVDGRIDPRFPRMQKNAVQSYCGAPIRDESGTPVGTLCHFDLMPCQAPSAELPLLTAAAAQLLPYLQPLLVR